MASNTEQFVKSIMEAIVPAVLQGISQNPGLVQSMVSGGTGALTLNSQAHRGVSNESDVRNGGNGAVVKSNEAGNVNSNQAGNVG